MISCFAPIDPTRPPASYERGGAPSGQTIVKPTALGPVANTDTKLLIYGLFQKGRVLAQDGVGDTTEFVIGSGGKLYLAALLDLYSRFLVGCRKCY